tara:strand:- start:23262 stop:23954 length:693 start_codon:yes stop_codon:yes gene_type:complete
VLAAIKPMADDGPPVPKGSYTPEEVAELRRRGEEELLQDLESDLEKLTKKQKKAVEKKRKDMDEATEVRIEKVQKREARKTKIAKAVTESKDEEIIISGMDKPTVQRMVGLMMSTVMGEDEKAEVVASLSESKKMLERMAVHPLFGLDAQKYLDRQRALTQFIEYQAGTLGAVSDDLLPTVQEIEHIMSMLPLKAKESFISSLSNILQEHDELVDRMSRLIEQEDLEKVL